MRWISYVWVYTCFQGRIYCNYHCLFVLPFVQVFEKGRIGSWTMVLLSHQRLYYVLRLQKRYLHNSATLLYRLYPLLWGDVVPKCLSHAYVLLHHGCDCMDRVDEWQLLLPNQLKMLLKCFLNETEYFPSISTILTIRKI